MATCLAASSSLAVPAHDSSSLTAAERTKAQAAIAQAVGLSALFEGMLVDKVKLGGTNWIEGAGGRKLLVSATVRFKSFGNVYCGAAVVDGNLESTTLIDGPPPIQGCRRIGGVAFVDINGDGPAIAQEIIVASNRDGSDAPFFTVYLPSKDGSSFCFSSQASDALYGIYPFNAATVQAKLTAEKRRLKVDRFECGR